MVSAGAKAGRRGELSGSRRGPQARASEGRGQELRRGPRGPVLSVVGAPGHFLSNKWWVALTVAPKTKVDPTVSLFKY